MPNKILLLEQLYQLFFLPRYLSEITPPLEDKACLRQRSLASPADIIPLDGTRGLSAALTIDQCYLNLGREIINWLPLPTSLFKDIEPIQELTICDTKYKPTPSP